MALQVTDAYNSFARFKRDITDVPLATFSEWADFINKFAYRKLISVDVERFILSTTFTITAAPQTSALPAGFKNILPKGTGFFLQDSEGNDTEYELPRTGFGSNTVGYYISGTNVVFTGITNYTVTLRYIPAQTKITGLSGYFTVDTLTGGVEIIPEEYLEYVIKAIDVLYSQWDDDVSSESFADARFVRVLNELIDNFRKEPDVYGLEDFTNSY